VRVAEVHVDVGRDLEVRVRGHLLALVPCERPTETFGELDDLRRDSVAHGVGLAVGRQGHEEREPGGALHDRRDLVVPSQPEEGNGPAYGPGKMFRDRPDVLQLAGCAPAGVRSFAATASPTGAKRTGHPP
jgi:hypothetical protein